MGWSTRKSYHGKAVNDALLQILKAGNRMLATEHFGGEREDATMYQGSWSGAAASAGTHRGPDAMDLSAYNQKNRVKVFRLLGMAAWYRPYRRNLWTAHIHAITVGGESNAKYQETEYLRGDDGLAGSGRDNGWRPSNLPIKFVYNGDLSDRYCTTACHLYDEPAATDRRAQVDVGEKVGSVVAVVNVGGDRWFITADGNCGFEDNFSTTEPTDQPEPEPEPEPQPQPEPKPVDRMDPANYSPGKTGPHITWLGQRLVAHGFGDAYDVGPGPIWGAADKANVQAFQRAQGWSGDDADGYPGPETLKRLAEEPRVTVPKVPAAEAAMFRTLNINVGYHYVPGYSSRLDDIEDVRDVARASLVFTTEAGTYDAGRRLNLEFGWGGKRGESFILHGGSMPITTAVHWNPSTFKLVDEGQFETTGTTHRYATWVKLEHRESGQQFVCGSTHLVPWPIGPNTVRKYDYQRESAFGSCLRQLVKIAGDLPVLVAGDLNGKRSDPYDGPGKAMAKYGFTEAKTGKAVIDRICGKGLKFTEHKILPTRGATDHDTAVSAYVTLNK